MNPGQYEGQIVRVCSKLPIEGGLLYSRLLMGRSPMAIRLDRPLDTRSKCIEAKMLRLGAPPSRGSGYERDPAVMDGPLWLKSWRLQVIRVQK
jgi:hypothetical protein